MLQPPGGFPLAQAQATGTQVLLHPLEPWSASTTLPLLPCGFVAPVPPTAEPQKLGLTSFIFKHTPVKHLWAVLFTGVETASALRGTPTKRPENTEAQGCSAWAPRAGRLGSQAPPAGPASLRRIPHSCLASGPGFHQSSPEDVSLPGMPSRGGSGRTGLPRGAPLRPAMRPAAPGPTPSLGLWGRWDSLPSLALPFSRAGLREKNAPAQDERGKVRTGPRSHEPPGNRPGNRGSFRICWRGN